MLALTGSLAEGTETPESCPSTAPYLPFVTSELNFQFGFKFSWYLFTSNSSLVTTTVQQLVLAHGVPTLGSLSPEHRAGLRQGQKTLGNTQLIHEH